MARNKVIFRFFAALVFLPLASPSYFSTVAFDGNRVVRGTGSPNIKIGTSLEIGSDLVWAVAAADGESLAFVLTCADGKAYSVAGGSDEALPLPNYSPRSPQQPPLVEFNENRGYPEIVSLSVTDISELSHPVPAGEDEFMYIATDGSVVLWNSTTSSRLNMQALPDGRIVQLNGQYALYGGPTDSYRHCVLGDCVEGTQLWLLNKSTGGDLSGTAIVELTNQVFEGLSPMFIGENILTTVATPGQGARYHLYSTRGELLSIGPTIGWGWRHQLFYNNFDRSGNLLVNVVAPHVRKTVEWLNATGPEMTAVASKTGYTTHAIDSRNLDAAVSGDFDGDGFPEAVVLSADRRSLVGLQLMDKTVDQVWAIRFSQKITTNVAAVEVTTDKLALGVGTGSTFHILLPSADPPTSIPAPSPSDGQTIAPTQMPPALWPSDGPTDPPNDPSSSSGTGILRRSAWLPSAFLLTSGLIRL